MQTKLVLAMPTVPYYAVRRSIGGRQSVADGPAADHNVSLLPTPAPVKSLSFWEVRHFDGKSLYRRSAEVPAAMGNVGLSTLPSNNPDQSSRTPFVVLIRRKGRIAFSDLQKPCASAFGTQSSPTNPSLI